MRKQSVPCKAVFEEAKSRIAIKYKIDSLDVYDEKV